jgi:hypothetical protein
MAMTCPLEEWRSKSDVLVLATLADAPGGQADVRMVSSRLWLKRLGQSAGFLEDA